MKEMMEQRSTSYWTALAPNVGEIHAVLLELVMTFGLVYTFYNTSIDPSQSPLQRRPPPIRRPLLSPSAVSRRPQHLQRRQIHLQGDHCLPASLPPPSLTLPSPSPLTTSPPAASSTASLLPGPSSGPAGASSSALSSPHHRRPPPPLSLRPLFLLLLPSGHTLTPPFTHSISARDLTHPQSNLTLGFTFHRDVTIATFKVAVAKKCDVPAEQQCLIYKGRNLKDDQTLLSYGVESDHTAHLVRGAAPTSANLGASGVPNKTSGTAVGVGPNDGLGFGARAGFGGSLFSGLSVNELDASGVSILFSTGLPELIRCSSSYPRTLY